MRFLDTMSMHIMCSGFTHAQRLQYQALEKNSALRSTGDEVEDYDDQQLNILLAQEKEKDFKAYARYRQIPVGKFRLFFFFYFNKFALFFDSS